MSVRTVSQLPLIDVQEIATGGDRRTNFRNSLVEVSYNTSEGKYDSMRVKLGDCYDHVCYNILSGGVDGKTVFNAPVEFTDQVSMNNSLLLSGDLVVNENLDDDEASQYRTHIKSGRIVIDAEDNMAVLQNPPGDYDESVNSNAIATCGWVKTRFLGSESALPEGTADTIEDIVGMLNKRSLVIYVDSSSNLKSTDAYVLKQVGNTNTSGIFLTDDATKQTPVNSIYDAIAIAQKVKFVQDSSCYIRLLTDVGFRKYSSNENLVQPMTFAHPDLVQNKYFSVQGWSGEDAAGINHYDAAKHEYDGPSGSAVARKISLDLRDPEHVLAGNRYVSLIRVFSRISFNQIVFNGMLGMEHFNDGSKFELKSSYRKSSYLIRNLGQDAVLFTSCMFKGLDIAYCGGGGNFTNVAFSYVDTCIFGITGGQRSDIQKGINVNNCMRFMDASFGGYVRMTVSSAPCIWKLHAVSVGRVQKGAQLDIQIWHTSPGIGLKQDDSGDITIDGVKYSKVSTAAEATAVNTLIAAFDVAKIVPNGESAISETKLTMSGTTDEDIQAASNAIIGQAQNGYGRYGYAELEYGAASWLKLFLDTTAEYDDFEIPNWGVVSF